MTSPRVARAVARGAAGWWTAVSHVAGRLRRRAPEGWHTSGGRRVLVVAPHPDDEIGCGGALLLHRKAGDETHVIYATDGRGSRAGGLGPDEMAERRRGEAAAVAPTLGLRSVHWLGLREWEWDDTALVAALSERLRAVGPDVVYAPSRIDFHPEHVRVAACLARALEMYGSGPLTVHVYQVQVPLTPVLVNLVAPIQPVAAELLAAMRGYQTQRWSLERCWRMKRYAAAYYGLPGYVEEFWQVDPLGYVRAHPRGGVSADGTFRGIRSRPFTDVLAYVQGLAERRRLRRLVEQQGAQG